MTNKATDNLLPIPEINKTTSVAANNDHKDFVFDKVLFDIDALSSLQSIFDSADSVGTKSVSVKFMITLKDEADLRSLGYSKEQIDQLKPQEAEDILKYGTKAHSVGHRIYR
jgi:hypothetical protein